MVAYKSLGTNDNEGSVTGPSLYVSGLMTAIEPLQHLHASFNLTLHHYVCQFFSVLKVIIKVKVLSFK